MATSRTGQTTDFTGQYTEASVSPLTPDSPGNGETRYTPDFDKWYGYYRKNSENRAVIDKFASWTFGKGIIADEKNQAKLDKIKGFGKDSPRAVLKRQWKNAMICGDSFAHIITDAQGRLTNVKPLGNLTIVRNSEGIIINFEDEANKKNYSAEEIYHLSYEPSADEGHGTPFAECMEDVILAKIEAMADLKVLYHRNIKPISFFEVETDDTTKIADIETTINNAYKKSENVVIPKGVLAEIKQAKIGQYATLDSLPYIKFLVRQFITGCGMPEVIMGWNEGATEAATKIVYLAFQQDIEDKQLYNEEMADLQLGIEFELEFPADLMEAQQAGVAQGLQSSQQQQGTGVSSPASFGKDGNKSAVRPADVKA
jgi:hypothetical protein